MTDDDIYILKKRKSSSCILYVIFGIFAFIFLYYPLYGGKARFTTGSYMSSLFRSIVTAANYISVMSFIFGLFLMFIHNFKSGIKWMLMGVAIYYVANHILMY